MKHSRYNEYFNYMSGNSKKNVKKENGNANKGVTTLIKDFDDKLLFWIELIHSKYDDDDFYLLRTEINQLHRAFLSQENVMFSTSNIFTYKGKKHECEIIVLKTTYGSFEQTNRQVVFHDFYRNKANGEIVILFKFVN